MQFVLAEYIRTSLKLSDEEARFYEEQDVLHPVSRNGRVFYSARDVYRLRGILHFRTQGMSFEMAKRRLEQPLTVEADSDVRTGRNN